MAHPSSRHAAILMTEAIVETGAAEERPVGAGAKRHPNRAAAGGAAGGTQRSGAPFGAGCRTAIAKADRVRRVGGSHPGIALGPVANAAVGTASGNR